jgi:hypothetical protein
VESDFPRHWNVPQRINGEVIGYDNFAKYETLELAYIVEVAHGKAKIGGKSEASDFALRITSIFAVKTAYGRWYIDTLIPSPRFGQPSH